MLSQYLKKFPGFVNECLGPTVGLRLLLKDSLNLNYTFQGRRDSWWLHQVMVRPEYQRKGIATSLINLVKQKVRIKA